MVFLFMLHEQLEVSFVQAVSNINNKFVCIHQHHSCFKHPHDRCQINRLSSEYCFKPNLQLPMYLLWLLSAPLSYKSFVKPQYFTYYGDDMFHFSFRFKAAGIITAADKKIGPVVKSTK